MDWVGVPGTLHRNYGRRDGQRDRRRDGEAGALAGLALNGNVAAEEGGKPVSGGKADAKAFEGAGEGLVDLSEGVKKVRLLCEGDTDAGVPDGEGNGVTGRAAPDIDTNGAACCVPLPIAGSPQVRPPSCETFTVMALPSFKRLKAMLP